MSKPVIRTPRVRTTTKPAEGVVMDPAKVATLIAKFRPDAIAKAKAGRVKAICKH